MLYISKIFLLVCETTILEFEKALSKVNPNLKVNVGGYRLDADGTVKQKTVSQINSEIFLSDKLDEICKKMDDYVRATKKSNGQLTLLKLIGDDGQMSPEMGEVDIIQDDDLNKSLKYYVSIIIMGYINNLPIEKIYLSVVNSFILIIFLIYNEVGLLGINCRSDILFK